ncbi:hypothetical protein L1277_001260 [Okibacterium sp. HSC-33S16]|uniref:hypothetical protein n=1 Tax=Okibacterium sp. HSC-33S16 TaxID=2910965 RepID=UPI00209F1FAC|nr:hypothetical protein [Okibacterium sp. HSC-33S16]MCP2031169.1 hypothetical protein [Okibacterium sp. HSC-33S16]
MSETEADRLDRLWSPEPTPIPVELGRWAFELRGDEIADLTFDDSPVVRSVRAVARDQDWNTVPATVEAFEPTKDGHRLRLSMRGFGVDITAAVDIVHHEDILTISLTATTSREFLTNRLGLVVLHPPELSGTPLIVATADDEKTTRFPSNVSPHQPAFDIRSLTWDNDGVHTQATFAGDIFEMEDQRNWTDASYKTYSRPLALPFPYPLESGESVTQSVSFSSERVWPPVALEPAATIELIRTGRQVPDLTLGASTAPDAAMPSEQAPPIPTGVRALLVELDTRTPSWPAALSRAISEAGDLTLDVRIVADTPDDVREAVAVVERSGAEVARLGVFSGSSHVTEPPLWAALAEAAKQLLPGVTLLGGARSHFTELNREHGRLPDAIPEFTFSLTPQMHATERAQLIESIPMQAVVARSAGDIALGRPLHIGPITLRSRFNAVATSTSNQDAPSDLSSGYGAELTTDATDARQSSDALEAWTIASFAAIASATDKANVASVSYFEAFGPRGLRNHAGAYPVAHAITALARLGGGELLLPSSVPRGVWCIGSRKPDGSWSALLTNLGSGPAAAVVVTVGGHTSSIEIAPYAVLRLSSAANTTTSSPDTNDIVERKRPS